MGLTVREARPVEVEAILPLFPRLADFELPPRRVAEHLWEGDADLLRRWAAGHAPECFVKIVVDAQGTILGVALVSMRPELLSHEPSAHLEALVISPQADGQGLGRRLLQAVEATARERGAQSMSLHVFANNGRARHIYEQSGYDGELMRYIKHLD